ncbi:MAG: hypothetical protein EA394_03295 [Bacteroidia bacterium]|nr:MAG: hypothetical protein EA394_03295 [Bacteroidia bacterium]
MLAILLICLFTGITFQTYGQNLLDGARIWGNFQLDAQYYLPDSVIDAPEVSEKIRMNGFANVNMSYRGFTVGLRYESYQNALLGYDENYNGHGIPYRFISYTRDNLEVTVGNYYEQFGSGLIFRTYEEKNLGIDNAMEGFRLVYRPVEGVSLRGVIGRQRLFFDTGPGIVRGFDARVNLNAVIPALTNHQNRWTIAGSVISKYQPDNNPRYHLPENVAAFAGRLNFVRGPLNISTEYAHKVNDPSADNNFIYKDGQALHINATYAVRGLGLLVSAKRIDNMAFRSDRNETGNNLNINYLPPATKQHLYSLSGMYPYATQPNGEIGFMSELNFTIPRETTLGGPYGTTVTLNYSLANSIHRERIHDTIPIGQRGTKGYRSDFFRLGDERYFQDVNIELNRRFSRTLRGLFSYAYITYNQNVIEGYVDKEMVYAHILIADMTYRLPNRRSLRGEFQHLSTRQDNQDWVMAMVEYNIAPNWFFAVSDQYNYGNNNKDLRVHYYTVSTGYTRGANRFGLSFGKQREGIICVGGVCRKVPASYGFTLNVTSSF